MAIQGLCPFSWSMSLNLVCVVRKGRAEEEKKEECENEVEVVRRGSCFEALINISPY